MNWVDAIIVLVLALYALHGWYRGLLLLLLDFGGFTVSLGIPLFLHRFGAPVFRALGLSPNLANAAAFLAMFLVAQVIYWVAVRGFYRAIPKSARSSILNRAMGVVPAVAKGIVICSLIVMLIVVLPTQVGDQPVLDSMIGSRMLHISSAIERAAASMFGGAIEEGLTFVTVNPKAKESLRIRAQTTDVEVDPRAEDEMLVMVNRERAAAGLKKLVMDPEMRNLARMQSRDMFARGYFSHVNPDGLDPFERMRRLGIQFAEAGENLAMAPTVRIAHEGLMNSPGHRANILDPNFGRVGIGICSSRVYGLMFSQEFRD